MYGTQTGRRGLFDGLKVPALELNAIILAVLALVLFQGGVYVMAQLASIEVGAGQIDGRPALDLNVKMLGNLLFFAGKPGRFIAETFQLPLTHTKLPLALYAGYIIWAMLLWSFFSAMLCRIAAMKLAREEGLTLSDALGFGARKFLQNIASLLFVGAIMGMFYGFFNATVAGWIGRIPYFGQGLLGVFFIFVLASSFVITFVFAMTLLGFNLSSAAVATESSDAFDGVSRSWNYILSKPWAFVLMNALIVFMMVLLTTFGHLFLKVSVASLGISNWGLSHKTQRLEPGKEAAALMGGKDNPAALKFENTALELPGAGEYLYNRVITRHPSHVGRYQEKPKAGGGTERVFTRHYLQRQPDGRFIDILPAIQNQGFLYFLGEAVNFWIQLFKLIIYGYVLNYFFAGQTTIYFLLRKEVDGDDYNEIIMGDEDDQDPFDLPSFDPANPPPPPGGPSKPADDKGSDKDGGRSLPMVMEV